jgi:hypothetical protein
VPPLRLENRGYRGERYKIATEILFNQCNVVIFFIDPLHPHTHIDDIRAVVCVRLKLSAITLTSEYLSMKCTHRMDGGDCSSAVSAKKLTFYNLRESMTLQRFS